MFSNPSYSTIAWNLLDSYYNDTWYNGHGLMTANQPWSGHYKVSSPIWTTGNNNFEYYHIKVKASSYIAQYSVLRTIQSTLHFTSLTDLFTQIPSRLLWEASSHRLQLMREGCSYTYPPMSIATCSFIQCC